jgi:hypothetical protein
MRYVRSLQDTGLWTNVMLRMSSEWMKRHHKAAQPVRGCERMYQ